MIQDQRNIYIAGPLFTDAERAFNSMMKDRLIGLGHNVHLPQDEGNTGWMTSWGVFISNTNAVMECDTLIVVSDGTDVDSGTAFEQGLKFGLWLSGAGSDWDHKQGPEIYLLRTDCREISDIGCSVNLMLHESAKEFFESVDDLLNYFTIKKRVSIKYTPNCQLS